MLALSMALATADAQTAEWLAAAEAAMVLYSYLFHRYFEKRERLTHLREVLPPHSMTLHLWLATFCTSAHDGQVSRHHVHVVHSVGGPPLAAHDAGLVVLHPIGIYSIDHAGHAMRLVDLCLGQRQHQDFVVSRDRTGGGVMLLRVVVWRWMTTG